MGEADALGDHQALKSITIKQTHVNNRRLMRQNRSADIQSYREHIKSSGRWCGTGTPSRISPSSSFFAISRTASIKGSQLIPSRRWHITKTQLNLHPRTIKSPILPMAPSFFSRAPNPETFLLKFCLKFSHLQALPLYSADDRQREADISGLHDHCPCIPHELFSDCTFSSSASENDPCATITDRRTRSLGRRRPRRGWKLCREGCELQ